MWKYDSQYPYYGQNLFTIVEKPFHGHCLFSELVGTAPYVNDTQGIMFVPTTKRGMLLTREQERQNQVRLRQDLTQASLNFEYLIDFMHPRSYEHMKPF